MPTIAPAPEPDGVLAEAVRDALRHFHEPLALARNPLGGTGGPRERGARVHALVEEAVDACFGSSPGEALLREVLRRGYLDPAGTHERVADELYLSRATYFRKLRRATECVAEYVGWSRVPASPEPGPRTA